MQTAEGYYYTDTLGETSNDPIILIHGVGGSHLSWPTAIRKIKGRRVICMDLPGHGSSAGSACQSVAAYARSIESLLRDARIYRAIFVGYSLGGQVALDYCINHPDQCAGLGLIACSSSPNVPARLLELLNDPSAGAAAVELIRSLMFAANTPPLKVKQMEKILFSARHGTTLADWRAFREFHFPDFSAELPGIPLWICSANNDKLIPSRASRMLLRQHVNATCAFIDACGHGILAEQPEAVGQALIEGLLLNKNSPV